MNYPATKRIDVVENHFGHEIADPYLWLEKDACRNKDVLEWVAAQKQTTASYLDTLPGRDAFRTSLTSLFSFQRISVPRKRGNRYFYTRQAGLEKQPVLYLRGELDGQERLLIDPTRWSEDGADALAEWSVSHDGTWIAYSVQEGGSDWRTIKVLTVNSAETLEDEIKWARFTRIEWAKDSSGFFYSRYPEPGKGAEAQSRLANHTVYFHRLGTLQSQDRLIFASPDKPYMLHSVQVMEDGRYAVIYSSENMATNAITILDLADPDWTSRKLVGNFDNRWAVLASAGTKLFLWSDQNAPRGKVVTTDLAATEPVFEDFLPEQASVLTDGHLFSGRLLVSYLADVKTEMKLYRLDGKLERSVELPGIGTAHDFRGHPEDPESFFSFTSFNTPGTVYRYDVATGDMTVWGEPNIQRDLMQIAIQQVFYRSKDGTRVPMFVIRRKDVIGPAPTLLYGYGGYAISLPPAYSPVLTAWVDQGGVLAIPNIRGGGEYGTAWHEAGRREKKQNVFDDFIAAGEYLKAEGITSQDGLAIQGESNGGLLVGAVINQRPDLFAAALPGVGVLDMLRFNTFTGGPMWVGEYGDPGQEADFLNLLTYSPYHNIQAGRSYPAILATTADTDDRVVPAHSFKYVAAIQAADLGPKPRLLRIETRAGHGIGKPTDKVIEEATDMLAFAARWTGLKTAPTHGR